MFMFMFYVYGYVCSFHHCYVKCSVLCWFVLSLFVHNCFYCSRVFSCYVCCYVAVDCIVIFSHIYMYICIYIDMLICIATPVIHYRFLQIKIPYQHFVFITSIYVYVCVETIIMFYMLSFSR